MTIVQQPFDMNLFLSKQIDAASAMTYNELAQVLETKNPKTGKLYKLNDLNVIKMADRRAPACSRTASSSTATGSRTRRTRRRAKKFLEASFQGWIYCRDHQAECVEHRAQERLDAPQGAPDVADERDQRARSGRRRAASAS